MKIVPDEPTEKMIEKVARAICTAHGLEPEEVYRRPNIGDSLLGWELWIDEAKAAIKAMREPTEEMIDAGWVAGDGLIDTWKVMINTALEEK